MRERRTICEIDQALFYVQFAHVGSLEPADLVYRRCRNASRSCHCSGPSPESTSECRFECGAARRFLCSLQLPHQGLELFHLGVGVPKSGQELLDLGAHGFSLMQSIRLARRMALLAARLLRALLTWEPGVPPRVAPALRPAIDFRKRRSKAISLPLLSQ
jgi:hypothetical protein